LDVKANVDAESNPQRMERKGGRERAGERKNTQSVNWRMETTAMREKKTVAR